jgi:hypothetical protein
MFVQVFKNKRVVYLVVLFDGPTAELAHTRPVKKVAETFYAVRN